VLHLLISRKQQNHIELAHAAVIANKGKAAEPMACRVKSLLSLTGLDECGGLFAL